MHRGQRLDTQYDGVMLDEERLVGLVTSPEDGGITTLDVYRQHFLPAISVRARIKGDDQWFCAVLDGCSGVQVMEQRREANESVHVAAETRPKASLGTRVRFEGVDVEGGVNRETRN